MKKKSAIFTTVKNEKIFLPIWLKYYQKYFSNEDIYILDHYSNDGSTLDLPVNVKLVENDYVNDHDWLVKIAEDFQRDLLKDYECVLFAESDEILYSLEKSFDQTIDEFIESDNLYTTFSGFSVIQNLENESPIRPGDRIFEKRNWWYKDSAEDKTLMSKVPLDWSWGFHNLKGRNNNYHKDCYIAHLHRFDLQSMIERHKSRTSFKQKNDGGGTHWKSSDDEIQKVFLQVSSQPMMIPEQHKKSLVNVVY